MIDNLKTFKEASVLPILPNLWLDETVERRKERKAKQKGRLQYSHAKTNFDGERGQENSQKSHRKGGGGGGKKTIVILAMHEYQSALLALHERKIKKPT